MTTDEIVLELRTLPGAPDTLRERIRALPEPQPRFSWTLPRVDFLLLFEGNLPTQRNSRRLLASLRTARRHGTFVIAIDTAAFALAQAGLKDDQATVLHWEAARAFAERFPAIAISNQIYHIGEGLGFAHVTLDLEGFRSGSMNASLLSIGRAKKNAED